MQHQAKKRLANLQNYAKHKFAKCKLLQNNSAQRKPHTMSFFSRATPPHFFTLMLLSSLSPLAMNTFLPALPLIAQDLDTTPEIVGLSVGLFLAVSAVLQIFGGFLGDYYGRRPVVLSCIAIFIFGTLAVHFAHTITQFLILRILQGGSAVVLLASRAIVHDTETPQNATSKIGYVTMGMAIMPMISPALGGWLATHYGWHSIFTFLTLSGVAVWVLCYFDLGETRRVQNASLAAQFAAYRQLVKSYRFWGYTFAAAFGSGSFFAYLGGAPLVGARDFGLTPDTLGLYFGAPAIGYFLGNWVSGANKGRRSVNTMIISGILIALSGVSLSLILSLLSLSSAWTFFGFMTLVGLGNGITLPSTMVGVMQVRPEIAGSSGGLYSAILIGIAAVLSALAPALLSNPAWAETPVLALMVICGVLGLTSALWAVYVERLRTTDGAPS